jgi:hypothetical protein
VTFLPKYFERNKQNLGEAEFNFEKWFENKN